MTRITKISLIVFFLLSVLARVSSAQPSSVRGFITDSLARPVENVSVSLLNTSTGTNSNKYGEYSLNIPPGNREFIIVFSHIGYKTEKRAIRSDGNVELNIKLVEEITKIGEITVRPGRESLSEMIMTLPAKNFRLLPSSSGSFEALLKTMPGVSSNNELSSQYSVRGGNFDENLVYVNDMEIFRPFLIRSGQQEGLSFINPDMVSSVRFSSGGFGAFYGDKMSSVLDISYKNPVATRKSFNPGLLTSSIHFEGPGKRQKLSYLIGMRYKSSRLMLKSLDAAGDYQPVFADIQSLFRYKLGTRSALSLLSAFSSNTYNFIPQSRVSTFGSDLMAYQLYVLFEGGEKDRYRTWNSVLTWEISQDKNIHHKINIASYNSTEKETFDIRGWYSLNTLDKEYGATTIGDSLMNIGVGNSLNHARNSHTADIFSISYKGDKTSEKSSIKWGLRLRNDRFKDNIKEWTMVDSSGYSLPQSRDKLLVTSLIKSENRLNNWLYDGYLQSENTFLAWYRKITLNTGIRALYNSFTEEFLVSPRISAGIEAGKNLGVYISGGAYFQPPFYREMRFPDGTINLQAKSQKSFHTVLGMKYYFKAWDRPFRLSAEIYNKVLSDIIPYRIDNMRIIYAGLNSAKGFSRGIDFHLNGEFVPGAESWISISIMDSKLEIPSGDLGKFPSPSDQTFNMNIFFQDYLPGYPFWRAHVNIAFVTGIPIISPFNERYDQYHRLPAYRRVDLGITRVIKEAGKNSVNTNFLKYFDKIFIGAEIFNLLDINNTISYLWIKTVNNLSGQTRQFAVPNYLTGRSLNLKLTALF